MIDLTASSELVRHRRRAAVDEDETVLSDVDRHVGAGAENDVDVRPDLDGFEAAPLSGGRARCCARRPCARCPREHESQRDQPRRRPS